MKKNTVYTIGEYMEQGFTESEAYAMRIFDKLQNRYDELTEKELEQYYAIAKRLDL